MNTSAFQCSVFISVMMVVVVYSASVHNCPPNKEVACRAQLRRIANASNHLLKENVSGMVPKVYTGSCTNLFFCLAEKALNNITGATNNSHHKFKDLQRALHQFNNMTNETHCPLDFKSKYQLHEFLKNVSKCTERILHLPRSIR